METDYVFERPEWHKQASCRGMDPNIFFPRRGESLDQAKEVCRGCPVQRQCETSAILYDEDYGVWGGEGRDGREKLMKRLIASGRLSKRTVGSKKPSMIGMI